MRLPSSPPLPSLLTLFSLLAYLTSSLLSSAWCFLYYPAPRLLHLYLLRRVGGVQCQDDIDECESGPCQVHLPPLSQLPPPAHSSLTPLHSPRISVPARPPLSLASIARARMGIAAIDARYPPHPNYCSLSLASILPSLLAHSFLLFASSRPSLPVDQRCQRMCIDALPGTLTRTYLLAHSSHSLTPHPPSSLSSRMVHVSTVSLATFAPVSRATQARPVRPNSTNVSHNHARYDLISSYLLLLCSLTPFAHYLLTPSSHSLTPSLFAARCYVSRRHRFLHVHL